MSKYRELLNTPPKLEIKKNSKEVVFTLISCMCDNVNYFTFKKDSDGSFCMNMGRHAISNLQIPGDYRTDLLWAADDQDWEKVISVINTGTSKIESVRSR